jgi:hypothetical protein
VILTAHQPAYLPWLGLISKIARADEFVLLDDADMSGRDRDNFVARNVVKTAQGPKWLSIPVRRHIGLPIMKVEVCNEQRWANKHWKTIEQAYGRAPYFRQYSPRLREILNDIQWETLLGPTLATMTWLLDALEVKTPLISSFKLGVQGSGAARLVDICKARGATKFVFGANGQDYVSAGVFECEGIAVEFQSYCAPVYPQLHGPTFLPNLSAVDALFNVGPKTRELL